MNNSILVIEDEPSIADNITYALETEGFKPIWAGTGEDARLILKKEQVALIILDVGLPDINGFELAKEIRGLYSIPLIFLTARSGEIDRVVGLELGADDYVVKPFSPRELTARVKAVLRRAQPVKTPAASSKLKGYGPFSIDEERYKISYHGTALELSRYEYGIMCVLIKSPGRVYTREHLMQLAWEVPEMSLERTVDTHIKTLRQKLRAVKAEEDPIVTHRGIGYSLKEIV